MEMESTKTMSETREVKSLLSSKLGGGPHGIGDPNDVTLRKVEREVLIPKKIRDKTKEEKCVPEVAAFDKCCKGASVLMVALCRNENTALRSCLEKWYNDEQFKEECKQEYLKERSEFRKTGVNPNKRQNLRGRLQSS